MKKSIKFTLSLIVTAVITLGSPLAIAQDTVKEQSLELLNKGLVQGDISFIKENVAEGYIQHNPGAHDKLTGLLGFVGYLKTLDTPLSYHPKRVLREGNLVLVHSEVVLGNKLAVFDLFRIENGLIAEHWDGIQEMPVKTVSGRSMVDGPTMIKDIDKTKENKKIVIQFVTDVLVNGKGDKLSQYIGEVYHQHNPGIADGTKGLLDFMGSLAENKTSFGYTKIHNVVAEGNFVFTQSEGDFGGQPTAFYDLFRVDNGLIVEHWDSIQAIPSKMAHENGMF